MTSIIINGILVLFAATMIYMLLWRVLFFDANGVPDPMAIEAFVARCKNGGSLECQGQLGALQQCFDEAGRDPKALRMSLERFRQLIERFHDTISVVANTAMGIGFLGTIVAMAGAAGGKVDPVQIIGLGMMSTMYGLLIALPGNMFHGLTNGRVMRFLDYTDALLEALDGRINPPTSPALVPSPGHGPPPNGRAHKRLPEVVSGNGHGPHPRNATRFDDGPESTTAKSSQIAQTAAHTGDEADTEHSAYADEQILEWLTSTGDRQNETKT
jgi:hypothetical protein